ncbi:hypothetical protein BD410DRAFT_841832 [Rickenella mellea]|uniref:Uncharacterized protein n=1 Tax=Rickenella mellea TaxID=50990 RepID=A0A4Y7PXN7_9AGAM|nr:hypothetical protein BD410DRAFT_841832 [Rickenella mellea]
MSQSSPTREPASSSSAPTSKSIVQKVKAFIAPRPRSEAAPAKTDQSESSKSADGEPSTQPSATERRYKEAQKKYGAGWNMPHHLGR